MKELTLVAIPSNVDKAIDFVSEQLEEAGYNPATVAQMGMVVDEVFANISSYAYAKAKNGVVGTVTIRVSLEQNPAFIELAFIDEGVPFNPLEICDPDTSLPFEQRIEGGLGMFLVKKLTDEVRYSYEDGRNILTVRKQLA